MSLKLIYLLIIFTLTAIVLVAEGRGGRGRGGSLGSTFYSRTHKKHSSSGGSSSRRKVVSGSPVHTTYTKSMISGHSFDQKTAAKHRSHRRRHKSHSSHQSSHSSDHSSHNTHSANSHGGYSSHDSHAHVDAPRTFHHSYTPSHTNIGSAFGSSAGHHNSGAYSHRWGGYELPPGHVYVTQTSSMPANAVYYAQPPRQSSSAADTSDFINGYLIGRSFSRGYHNHNHHYHYHRQEPEKPYNGSTSSQVTSENNTNLNDFYKNNTTNETSYWPTDFPVSLAPLNNTLHLDADSQPTHEPIYKGLPSLSAQKFSMENSTFELPTATAAPPDTPPTTGIICMPWLFNETNPTHPERIVTIEKTICFPAPSPPPLPSTTPLAPIAGDIGVDTRTTIPTTTTEGSVQPLDFEFCKGVDCSSVRGMVGKNLVCCPSSLYI